MPDSVVEEEEIPAQGEEDYAQKGSHLWCLGTPDHQSNVKWLVHKRVFQAFIRILMQISNNFSSPIQHVILSMLNP